MIRFKAREARLAGVCDAVSCRILGQDLGDQEYAIALTGDRVANEFLVAIELGRIDHRHPERNASAKSLCMRFLPQTHGTLTERRDDDAVTEPDRACIF